MSTVESALTLLLFFWLSYSNSQNSASLLNDKTLFSTKDALNRDLRRINAGVHISGDNTFVLVVNELTVNAISSIVVYVIQQNYTVSSSTVVLTLSQTSAYSSGVDSSNAIYIFGDSSDININNCPPLDGGTETKGFVMKLGSPTSSSPIFCRTTTGLLCSCND